MLVPGRLRGAGHRPLRAAAARRFGRRAPLNRLAALQRGRIGSGLTLCVEAPLEKRPWRSEFRNNR
eukprot:7443150-Lingulodinium_polyedra.AAC.1